MDKDVLGKADALLRRHSGNPVGVDTGGVPVLTDLVDPTVAKAPEDRLAREIHERVLAEVEARLGTDLERRLARALFPHVHAAVATALAEVKPELSRAVSDAVAAVLEARQVK
jgi:hypothetical protein